MKLSKNKKIELILGISFYLMGIVCFWFQLKAMDICFLLFAPVILVFIVKNTKEHVYWKDKKLLAAYSVYLKMIAYTSFVFALSKYPSYEIMGIMSIALCTIYMFLAYFNKRQYGQMLEAFLYMLLAALPSIILWR